MLNIKKILLLVDFPETAVRVIHQAAMLARHYQAEIVLLHVGTKVSHAAGVPRAGAHSAQWDMLSQITQAAGKNNDESLESELHGLPIRTLLREGDTSHAILETARDEKISLIMMASYGHAFDRFLIGTVTPKMIHGIACPVWTDAAVAESANPQAFTVRNILCGVDFQPRSYQAAIWASQIAADFNAHLTLAHVTAGVEFWGPGGYYVNQEWKTALVTDATQRMAQLQKTTGVKADVIIDSGDVPTLLAKAAQQIHADVLVTGCQPYGGYLRTHGYSIIRASFIPVLSV